MSHVPRLILPEDWKSRTKVFVERQAKVVGTTPLISAQTYDQDRRKRLTSFQQKVTNPMDKKGTANGSIQRSGRILVGFPLSSA